MATAGNTPEPTSSAEAFADTLNLFAVTVTLAAGGPWRITRAAVWAAAYGSNVSARTMIWRTSDGVVYAQSAPFTMVARTFSNSGSDLYDMALESPLNAVGGASVWVGFGIAVGGSCFFGKFSTGSYRAKDSPTSYGQMTSSTVYSSGALGAYVTYILGNNAPLAPTLLTPTGVIIGTDLTPALGFRYDDPDGDNMSGYEVQISTVSNFASTVWSSGKILAVVADNATVIVNTDGGAWGPAMPDLSRGVLYYYRVRCYDSGGTVGPWSP